MERNQWTLEKVSEMKDILKSKSYRKHCDTWGEFCRKQWNISRALSYWLMSGKFRSKKNIPASLRWEIWERDDFRCVYCGARRFLSIDHVIPESKGGTLDRDNLATACMSCNLKKGNKTNG